MAPAEPGVTSRRQSPLAVGRPPAADGEHAPSPQDEYRELMSCFPTGVAVVTSLGADGVPRGLTCSALASVTLSPPTLLVCLHLDSGTFRAVRSNGMFAVNLLHSDGQEAAHLFSTPGGDRFSKIRWRTSASGVPLLVDGAFAHAECRVTGTISVGDHAVVIGEAIAVTRTSAVPLLYGLRHFSVWPGHERNGDGAADPQPS
ncbi:flavin reductase family protein [Actinocrinis puniceicyclus]|uniref:Flavin reductase family protein n=1 Tax=Actinocrinis puniceicyclus TaxID=977794 RepID=A0A8J8BD31_9ACTN|nr:flavin reductase family protein [Actinocrinis puniceicyclus]MBS2962379.1 flavin reductase family protein [Actinocrinis puniceicyclus]